MRGQRRFFRSRGALDHGASRNVRTAAAQQNRRPAGAPAEADGGWGLAFEQLARTGHRHRDVLNYTMHQFRVYLELSIERDRRQRREWLEDAAIAYIGGETLTARLKALQD